MTLGVWRALANGHSVENPATAREHLNGYVLAGKERFEPWQRKC
jgi:hypothetical protein